MRYFRGKRRKYSYRAVLKLPEPLGKFGPNLVGQTGTLRGSKRTGFQHVFRVASFSLAHLVEEIAEGIGWFTMVNTV